MRQFAQVCADSFKLDLCKRILRTDSPPRLCLAMVLITLSAASAVAQQGFNNNGFGPQAAGANASTVKFKGVLKGSEGNVIQVQGEDGSPLFIMLPREKRNMEYQADLELAQIPQGMLARFKTSVEAVQSKSIKTSAIDLFAAEEQRTVNLRNPREAMNVVPGVYFLSQMGFANSTEVQIVGGITGFKDKTLTVNAGQAVSIEVGEDVDLTFRSSSMHLAKPGDEVEGVGLAYNGQKNQIAATKLTVVGKFTESELEAAGKKNAKKKRSRRARELEPDEKPEETNGDVDSIKE